MLCSAETYLATRESQTGSRTSVGYWYKDCAGIVCIQQRTHYQDLRKYTCYLRLYPHGGFVCVALHSHWSARHAQQCIIGT